MEATDVANMEDYFGRQLSEDDYRRMTEQQPQDQGDLIAMAGLGDVPTGMIGGDTLDDIVMQNQKEILRRRTMQPPFGRPTAREDADPRRSASMMEFGGSTNNGNLSGYQFAHSPVLDNAELPPHAGSVPPTSVPQNTHLRRPTNRDLALDTQFANLGQGFNAMQHQDAYPPALNSATSLSMSGPGPYDSSGLSAGLVQSMTLDFPSSGLEHVSSGEVTPMNHFAQTGLQHTQGETHYSPMHPDFTSHLHGRKDPGGGNIPRSGAFEKSPEQITSGAPGMRMAEPMRASPPTSNLPGQSLQGNGLNGTRLNGSPTTLQLSKSPSAETPRKRSDSNEPVLQKLGQSLRWVHSFTIFRKQGLTATTEASILNSTSASRVEQAKAFKGIYSSSGFDMLNVLVCSRGSLARSWVCL